MIIIGETSKRKNLKVTDRKFNIGYRNLIATERHSIIIIIEKRLDC